MKNLSPSKERILQYLDTKGISKNRFYRETGVSNGTLDQKSDITLRTIERIISTYGDIDIRWLISGEGDMIEQEPSTQIIPATPETGIPLIPVDAMAGWLTGEVQFSPDDIAYYNLPNFRGADFIIKVKGDSMQPKYFSGDLAVCKKLPLSDLFFQWGKTYVLDTDQGALIKRIDKGESAETISLVSYNREYAPFELHRSSIHNVALVMGIIREE